MIRGKPRKLDDAMRRDLIDEFRVGANLHTICGACGISRRTLNRYFAEDPALRTAMKEARRERIRSLALRQAEMLAAGASCEDRSAVDFLLSNLIRREAEKDG